MQTDSIADLNAAWAAAEAQVAAEEAGGKANEVSDKQGKSVQGQVGAEGQERGTEADEEQEDSGAADEVTDTSAEAEAKADADDENAEPSELQKDREIARLKALAEKHGYKLEGDLVSVDERAAFRAERRQSKERLRAEREAWEKSVRDKEADFTSKATKLTKLQAAIEAQDLDAIAAELGHESWTGINQHFLRQKASPEAKRIEALSKALAEKEAREQADKAERTAKEQAVAVERQRKEYFATLSGDVDDFDDESIRALGKVDGFKEIVLKHEQAEYDPNLGRTITREEAIKRAYSDAEKSYRALHAVFGGTAASAPVKAANGKPIKRPSGKSEGVSDLALDQIDTSTPEGNELWFKRAAAQMKQANGG